MRKPKLIQRAFPNCYQEGMTLRDHFAATALPTIFRSSQNDNAEKIAATAYAIADAMMQRRDAA
ncbi:MAG TPA: hypothetical protein VL981_11205 [Candidatus Methylacidiphilales bacterium]|nr:hypothetical protein [Candidatus Methylacidiphilales bacterium]